jgi:hypothetical protein
MLQEIDISIEKPKKEALIDVYMNYEMQSNERWRNISSFVSTS